MQKNVGTIDRIARVMIALVIGLLFLADIITGITAIVLGIIALALLVTGLLGWCSLYKVFGIKTVKKTS